MNANRMGYAALAVGALVLLAAAAEAAAPTTVKHEAAFAAKGIEARPLGSIAMLPPVAEIDNLKAELAVEQGWLDLCAETKTSWMRVSEVLARLQAAPGAGAGLVQDFEAEIWRLGAVTPETGARLARALGVDAVLSIRIERWEIVDGGRGTVAITATLTGANGARLWSVSGRCEHGAGLTSGEANWTDGMAQVWNPRLDPRAGEQRLDVALYALLASWSADLPAPLYGVGIPAPMLAGSEK